MTVDHPVFKPTLNTTLAPATTQAQDKKKIVRQPGALMASSGSGGFGNQQTSMALEQTKIIYADILLHNVNVSVQEYQKKVKLYQKMINKKYSHQVYQPEI